MAHRLSAEKNTTKPKLIPMTRNSRLTFSMPMKEGLNQSQSGQPKQSTLDWWMAKKNIPANTVMEHKNEPCRKRKFKKEKTSVA